MLSAMISRQNGLSPIGLDIGETAARAVQLRRRYGKWQLAAASSWDLRRAGSQRLEVLRDRLGRAVRQDEFVRRHTVVGLSQPDLELHALELPEATDAKAGRQIEAAARWEIERLSRIEEGGMQTAHWRLPKGKGTPTTAIGAAVPVETVDGIMRLCQEAGADCRCVDAAPCALARSGAVLRSPGDKEVWGVLDLGARGVRLALCVGDVPVLARAIDGGGVAWTQKIAQALKVSEETAELQKCDHGIPAGKGAAGRDSAAAGDGRLAELAGMIFSAVVDDLDRVAREVERSYEYVLQCYPGREAGELILVGGSAALGQLDQYLSGRLGISVARADDFLDRPGNQLVLPSGSPALREPLSAYMCAIGLAIAREAGR